MAFRKALKRTVMVGGGAAVTAFGLSQLIEYRKKQVSCSHLYLLSAWLSLFPEFGLSGRHTPVQLYRFRSWSLPVVDREEEERVVVLVLSHQSST